MRLEDLRQVQHLLGYFVSDERIEDLPGIQTAGAFAALTKKVVDGKVDYLVASRNERWSDDSDPLRA